MHVVTIFSLITCVVANLEDDIFAGNDPKDNYFRYVRTYTQEDYKDLAREASENIPKPFGFRIYYPDNARSTSRVRRDDGSDAGDGNEGDDLPNFDDESKPLELDVLDTENSTESSVLDDAKNDLVINDFIRFKRDVEKEKVTEKTIRSYETKDDVDVDNLRSKREHERSGKMLLSAGEKLLEGNREPRGAVKDQWLKQPYPVQTSDPNRRNFDDNLPPLGDLPPAPRVHFVTQRRSESAPPLVYHSYEREGRSRDLNLNRQRDIDLERDLEPAYYPRPPRHYNSQSPSDNFPQSHTHQDRRPDLFYRGNEYDIRERDRDMGRNRELDRERDRHAADRNRGRIPQYNYSPQAPPQDRYYDEDRPIPSASKQRRIIYYATLPDIVRTPPSMGRERFNYRDDDRHSERDNRFTPEDRYASQPISIGSGIVNYRFRNEGPSGPSSYDNTGGKSRYDEATAKSASYPTKVSSPDVNIRALKKNPERRIYTEVERRYPYKTPNYHHDDSQFDRNHR